MNLSDQQVFELLCGVIVLLVCGYGLWLLVRVLGRTRAGFNIGIAVVAAFAVRVLASVGLGQLSIARDLRGGDELLFLSRADEVAHTALGSSDSLDLLVSELHTFVISLNGRMLGTAAPEFVLRTEMLTFAVIGTVLLAAAVYELAGARASVIAAWILALEPANVFFSSLLHKEPLMYLAEGMVVFGAAVLWKRGNVTALIPMVLGCLIAMATRPYAGWFLTAAAAAVVLHASLTRQRGIRSIFLTTTCVVLIGLAVPVVWDASSDKNLEELQQSQNANAADEANLSLEEVDYSTRERLVLNLPKRIRDVVLRPYIWQTQNASQQLGAVGTLVVLACLALLVVAIATNRHAIMRQAGPLVYPAAFMLVAYALSAGNAGTAYRYRTHIVGMAMCLIIVLLAHRRQEQEGLARVPRRPGLGPLSRTRTAA